MDRERELKGFNGVFAERLRALMDENQTTQKVLAEQTDTSRQTISQYMDGTAIPNIERLRNICKYFDVPSDYLLGLTNLKSMDISDRYLKDTTGLSSEAIKTLNALHHGIFPKELFITPSKFDMGVINYLLFDLNITREFLKRLLTYFDKKQEVDKITDKQSKQGEETGFSRYLLNTFMEQRIDDCYNDFFKPYKNGKVKPGRKRKESVSNTSVE